ncbi:hypothetical protein DL546_008827 [Coniochaeta pulveracea]|uniref:Transcription factor domain-containing protein n=1 Tax=Coniochaeta pulveracea TaxID=177199 RepID=A0A420YHT2_9PEZI|nr:hypothetical protein DL546_008827 [Coniochaeta pulveracea]
MDFSVETTSDMVLPETHEMEPQVMEPFLATTQDTSTFSQDLMSLPLDNISYPSFLNNSWSWPHASIQPRIGDASQAPWSSWTTLTPDSSLSWSPEDIPSCSFSPSFTISSLRSPSLRRALEPLLSETSIFRHSTNQILESVRAYPLMMLRRETFPPFIHPHWFSEGSPALPEALGHCMSIAHMFAWRNEETRPFLWSAVEAEVKRLVLKRKEMGLDELLSAVQALQIYMIMRYVDGVREQKDLNARLVLSYQVSPRPKPDRPGSSRVVAEALVDTSQVMCKQFKHECFFKLSQAFCEVDDFTHRPTWEEWVFAESRRRTVCLFYVVCRCISFDTDQCQPVEIFKMLPLPATRLLWEAKSRAEWEAEYTAYCSGQGAPMMQRIDTMAVLVDFYTRRDEDPGIRAMLDYWNSTSDGLSSLINLAAMEGG